MTLLLDGREVASQTYSAPGTYTLESPPVQPAGAVAMVEIAIDRTFFAPATPRARHRADGRGLRPVAENRISDYN